MAISIPNQPLWDPAAVGLYRQFIAFLVHQIEEELRDEEEHVITPEDAEAREMDGTPLGAENLVGFAYARKIIDGMLIDRPCLTVSVVRKLQDDRLIKSGYFAASWVNRHRAAYYQQNESRDVVRRHLRWEILTDVVEVGRPEASAWSGREYDARVPGGARVGVPGVSEGTLGAWLKPVTQAADRYFLTCWHCVSNVLGTSAVGSHVYQTTVGTTSRGPRQIATVQMSMDPQTPSGVQAASATTDTTVDAVLARADPDMMDACKDVVGDFLLGIGEVSGLLGHGGITSPIDVRKAGSTSEVTSGNLWAVTLSENISVHGQSCWYVDQLGITTATPTATTFSESGDSGAIVVDVERRAVGMVVGRVPYRFGSVRNTLFLSLATPIDLVLQCLDPNNDLQFCIY